MACEVLELTDATFDQAIETAAIPVLVDFYHEHCAPCRKAAPVVQELSQDFCGKLVVAKINVIDNQEVPSRFSVSAVPTFLIFKSGTICDRMLGYSSKDRLIESIERCV